MAAPAAGSARVSVTAWLLPANIQHMCRAFLTRTAAGWLARLLVSVLVFAQAMVAAHACSAYSHGVGEVLAGVAEHEHGTPCHEPSQTHERSPNICVAHCTAFDQNSGVPQIPVAALPDSPVLTLPSVSACAAPERVQPCRQSCRQTGPPLAIRPQVLRI